MYHITMSTVDFEKLVSEAYSIFRTQSTKVSFLATIVNEFQPLTFFAKKSI